MIKVSKFAIIMAIWSQWGCKHGIQDRRGDKQQQARPNPDNQATPTPSAEAKPATPDPKEAQRLPEPPEEDPPTFTIVRGPEPSAFHRPLNQNFFLSDDKILDISRDSFVEGGSPLGIVAPITGVNSAVSPVVKLTMAHKNKTGNVCTGSFISSEYIITAAHCFPGDDIVTVGAYYGPSFSLMVKAKKAIIGLGADVAILKTFPHEPGKIKYPRIQRKCTSENYSNRKVTIVGRRNGDKEGKKPLAYIAQLKITEVIKSPLAKLGITYAIKGSHDEAGANSGDSGGPWFIGDTQIAVTGGSGGSYQALGNRICDGLIP
ncbi:MAG: trypsin-like serine protease [Oligoflexales bacterium]